MVLNMIISVKKDNSVKLAMEARILNENTIKKTTDAEFR